MGTYEPNDSRNVTQNPERAPGEPPRTGPREGETRRSDDKHPVRQENNAQEATDGDLPDPHRAARGFDQDEG